MKINYILTLISVFCIGASIPVLTGSSQMTEQHSAKSEVPYCVTRPPFPPRLLLTEKPLTSAAMTVANGWIVK